MRICKVCGLDLAGRSEHLDNSHCIATLRSRYDMLMRTNVRLRNEITLQKEHKKLSKLAQPPDLHERVIALERSVERMEQSRLRFEFFLSQNGGNHAQQAQTAHSPALSGHMCG